MDSQSDPASCFFFTNEISDGAPSAAQARFNSQHAPSQPAPTEHQRAICWQKTDGHDKQDGHEDQEKDHDGLPPCVSACAATPKSCSEFEAPLETTDPCSRSWIDRLTIEFPYEGPPDPGLRTWMSSAGLRRWPLAAGARRAVIPRPWLTSRRWPASTSAATPWWQRRKW